MDANIENKSDFLENTLDERQKTKRVSKDELIVWRFCLIKRLQQYSQLGTKLSIENMDFNDQILGLFNPMSPDSKDKLPHNLAKSVLRFKEISTSNSQERQLLVVTLYLKKPSDTQGTILVQGNTCPYFGVKEFNALQTLVKSTPTADENNLIELYSHINALPLNEIDIDTEVTTSKSSHDCEIDPSTTVKSVHRDLRRMSHRFISKSPASENEGQNLDLENSDLDEMINHTATRVINERFKLLQQEMQRQLVLFQLQMKNEQKAAFQNIKQENAELISSVNKLKNENQKLSSLVGDTKKYAQKLELKIQTLSTENQHMRNTIDNQIQRIDKYNNEIMQLKDSIDTHTYADAIKSNLHANTVSSIQHNQPQIPVQQTLPQNHFQYNITTSNQFQALSDQKESNFQDQRPMPMQTHTPPRSIPVQITSDQYQCRPAYQKESSVYLSDNQHQCNPATSNVNPTYLSSSQYQSRLAEDVSAYDENNMTPSQTFQEYQRMSNGQYGQNKGQSHSQMPHHLLQRNLEKKPIDSLYQMKISDKTDYLLLGDSCLFKLDADKMILENQYKHPQKICVSGIKASDISVWIQSQPTNQNVKKVIIHAGVNDAQNGIVSQEIWSHLISMFQLKFPNAQIVMSSIIPLKSDKQANTIIKESNMNLCLACSNASILFINHTNTFRTANDAPKQTLYQTNSQKHPSIRGMLLLARNLKYPGVDFKQWYKEMQIRKIQADIPYQPNMNFTNGHNIPTSQIHFNPMNQGQNYYSTQKNNVGPQTSMQTNNTISHFDTNVMPSQALVGQSNNTEFIDKVKVLLQEIVSLKSN